MMPIGSIFISFLYALLYCALIILVAFAFLYAWRFVTNSTVDPDVYKWGQVVVGLLCAIVLLSWLLTALGLLTGGPFPFHTTIVRP